MTMTPSRQTTNVVYYLISIFVCCFILLSNLLETAVTVQAFVVVAPPPKSISRSSAATASDSATTTIVVNTNDDDIATTSSTSTRSSSSSSLGERNLVMHDNQDTTNEEEFVDRVLTDALYQINMIMEEYFMEHCPDGSLQQLFRTCRGCVEMMQSTIPNAGNGLFATEDIPAGQIVTFYPVHTLGVVTVEEEDGDETYYSVALGKKNNNGEKEHAGGVVESTTNVAGSAYTLYLLGTRPLAGVDLDKCIEGVRPFADIQTSRPIVRGWMGHLINDGAIVTKVNDTKYYTNSLQAQNCVIAPFGPSPVLVAVTTKPVRKGDELFASYGYSYWSEMLAEEDESVRHKSEEIVEQEMGAMEDLFTTFDTLEKAYEEEAFALHAAFDTLLTKIHSTTLY